MDVVGRYRLLRRIDRGGVAEVYEARLDSEYGFQRRFALKRPLKGAELDVLVGFADEALLLSHLDHPGIVSVFEFGSNQGWPFQVLEYVDGCNFVDLRARVNAAGVQIQPKHALRLVADAAVALDYAHRAQDRDGNPLGIVHRDVSPENILVSKHGQVKVIDFGIARSQCRMTRTFQGIAKGHLRFMAPERFEHRKVGPYTDVFSLGCVLHYLLTGESPALPLEHQNRAGAVQLSADLDEDVAQVVETAVRREPNRRFTSARDLAAACLQCLKRRGGLDHEELRSWIDGVTSPPDRAATTSAVPEGFSPGESPNTRPDVELTLRENDDYFQFEHVALLETLQKPLVDPHEDRTFTFEAVSEAPNRGPARGHGRGGRCTAHADRPRPRSATIILAPEAGVAAQ